MENPLLVLPPVQGFGGDVNAPDGMLAINLVIIYLRNISLGAIVKAAWTSRMG